VLVVDKVELVELEDIGLLIQVDQEVEDLQNHK
jgi:hypothetical protein